MPLLGSMGGVPGDSWAKDRLVNSNPKVLVSPMGVLIKGAHEGKALMAGETTRPKTVGEVISGTYIYL